MAWTKHKRKENGTVVPVYRGLAKEVVDAIKKLDPDALINYQFLSGYNGRSKVRFKNASRATEITVCDNEHGKCRVTVTSANDATTSHEIRGRLSKEGIRVEG